MTAASAPAVLRLDGIRVDFGGIRALNDLSLSVSAGEVLGLIGPNGAGKTTTFDVVSGVRRPDAGTVVLDGRDVTRTSAAGRARHGVRRTFQRVQTFGWLSVEDNILIALETAGGGGGFLADLLAAPSRRRRERERRARAREYLERCGLGAVRNELAGSLPIGLARMLELARAIVDGPKVLLLDEPASGLDQVEAGRLCEQIERVRTETGCALLLVEHDPEFVMGLCERIVVLVGGAVLAQGSPAEIQQSAAVREAYLGPQRSEAPTPAAER
jgi:branched-chain amino acid transport system ATP-binding protein